MTIAFALPIGFCVVLLSYWVYEDGSELDTLLKTVSLLEQRNMEIDELKNSEKTTA